MAYKIEFWGTQGRAYSDLVDYFFRVLNGETLDVKIGITGQAINPIGQASRTGEQLSGVAEAWIRLHLDRGIALSAIPDVPTTVVDFWVENGNLPPTV